jgi:hypothetical protein
MTPGLIKWHARHLAPMAGPAAQALRRSWHVVLPGTVVAVALLGAFGQVVQASVLRADAMRAATLVQGDSVWRCEALVSASSRSDCRGEAGRVLTAANVRAHE